MTVAESIIGGIVVAMLSGLLGSLLGSRNKVTYDEMERHKENPNPHVACPVHQNKLETIEKKLDTMDKKLDQLMEK